MASSADIYPYKLREAMSSSTLLKKAMHSHVPEPVFISTSTTTLCTPSPSSLTKTNLFSDILSSTAGSPPPVNTGIHFRNGVSIQSPLEPMRTRSLYDVSSTTSSSPSSTENERKSPSVQFPSGPDVLINSEDVVNGSNGNNATRKARTKRSYRRRRFPTPHSTRASRPKTHRRRAATSITATASSSNAAEMENGTNSTGDDQHKEMQTQEIPVSPESTGELRGTEYTYSPGTAELSPVTAPSTVPSPTLQNTTSDDEGDADDERESLTPKTSSGMSSSQATNIARELDMGAESNSPTREDNVAYKSHNRNGVGTTEALEIEAGVSTKDRNSRKVGFAPAPPVLQSIPHSPVMKQSVRIFGDNSDTTNDVSKSDSSPRYAEQAQQSPQSGMSRRRSKRSPEVNSSPENKNAHTPVLNAMPSALRPRSRMGGERGREGRADGLSPRGERGPRLGAHAMSKMVSFAVPDPDDHGAGPIRRVPTARRARRDVTPFSPRVPRVVSDEEEAAEKGDNAAEKGDAETIRKRQKEEGEAIKQRRQELLNRIRNRAEEQ